MSLKDIRESVKPSKDGNVVLGFTSSNVLMLDLDDHTKKYAIRFAKNYAKFHKLGSAIVLRTSKPYLISQFGNWKGHYAVIFGLLLCWKEIRWHINETKRLEVIDAYFAKLREFGTITIRVNSKNKFIPPPEIIYFYNNGDMRGIIAYIKHKNVCEGLGESRIP